MKKIRTVGSLLRTLKKFKAVGKTIGFTNGCFDILHPGHVEYLENIKRYADILVLGLNSDKSVKKIKGKSRPIVPEMDRARVLSAFEMIDYIVIFDEETPYELINAIRPKYLFKGADWKLNEVVGRDIVESYGGGVISIPYLEKYSTTKLLEKIWKKGSYAS